MLAARRVNLRPTPAPRPGRRHVPAPRARGRDTFGGGMFGDDSEPTEEEIRIRGNKSPKGESFEAKNRRKGRPAWRRSPDDTPLRDGNRDRLVGLLTARAVRTLATYLAETNLHLYHWLTAFEKANPIPRDGAWDDVSGTTFLRKLLAMPVSGARYDVGREELFNNFNSGLAVDPRQIAQRILDIRKAIAAEWRQDLEDVGEENAIILREAAAASLAATVDHPFDSSTDEDDGDESGPD